MFDSQASVLTALKLIMNATGITTDDICDSQAADRRAVYDAMVESSPEELAFLATQKLGAKARKEIDEKN